MIAQRDLVSESRQARIREKVAVGELPRAVGAFALGAAMSAASAPRPAPSSHEVRCDACDEPGPARTFAGLRWHDPCFAFWQAMTAQIDN